MQNGFKNYFSFSYILGLSIVFVIFAAGQIYLQLQIKNLANIPQLINVAGKQRMLSQKLSKAAILSVKSETDKEKYLEELKSTLNSIEKANLALRGGNEELKANSLNNARIINMFVDLEGQLQSLTSSSSQLIKAISSKEADPASINNFLEEIINSENAFLTRMDAIVNEYTKTAKNKTEQLETLSLWFGLIIFAILILEILFIFRPTDKFIRESLDLQNRQIDILNELIEERSIFEKMQSESLASISYEIRIPMNNIAGITTILNDTPLTQEQKEHLHNISNSADSVLTLLNDVWDFSRIDSGKLSLEVSSFDLRNLIEETINIFYGKAEEKEIEVILSFDPEMPRYFIGDPKRIRQIISNLSNFILDCTKKNEVLIFVKASKKDEFKAKVEFHISDLGPNFLEESFLENVDDEASFKLRVAELLVELMNGELCIRKGEEGTQIIFNVVMPLDKDFRNNNILSSRLDENLDEIKGKKILLLGENPLQRQILQGSLGSLGLNIQGVGSEQNALEKLENTHLESDYFRTIIIDTKNIDVENFIKKTRSIAGYKDTKIIVFTNPNKRTNLDTNYKNIYSLNKPLKSSRLFECLEEILVSEDSALVNLNMGSAFNILVVEDNLVNQKVAICMLQKLGCKVDTALNGKEALEKINSSDYDLIFMDCQMPEMDGFTATNKIRKLEDPLKKSIPIIAMTASVTKESKNKCLESGMNDYISKPVKVDDFKEALKRLESFKVKSSYSLESPLDKQVLNKIASLGDKDFVNELLRTYLVSSFEEIKELNRAILSSDTETISLLTQKLRSSSADIGAKKITQLCNELDAVNDLASINKAVLLIETINREFQRVKEEINHLSTIKR